MISENLAIQIATNLRKFGYPDVTPDTVKDELASDNPGIIGMMAEGMLYDNGLDRDGKPLPFGKPL